ncbi:hypothetical protein ACTFIU_005627 [Dictyostelium citrinum]
MSQEQHSVYLINPSTNMENNTFQIYFKDGVLYWDHVKSYAGLSGYTERNTGRETIYQFHGDNGHYYVDFFKGNTPEKVFKSCRRDRSLEGFNTIIVGDRLSFTLTSGHGENINRATLVLTKIPSHLL